MKRMNLLKRWMKIISVLGAFCFSLVFFSKIGNAEGEGRGKTILIFLDYISSQDLFFSSLPGINRMVSEGSVGLMTLHTGGAMNLPNAYLTLGTGTRSLSAPNGELFLHTWEEEEEKSAQELYRINMAANPEAGWIINPNFPSIIKVNQKKNYSIEPGAIGKAAREADLRIAVLGNGDLGSQKRRTVGLFGMDDTGVIYQGNLSRALLNENSPRPYGISQDYEILRSEFERFYSTSDIIAIQLGDLSRAEEYRSRVLEAKAERYKKLALEEADGFIRYVSSFASPEKDRIMIVCPLGNKKEMSEGNRLAPVILWGKDVEPSGWLTSSSTRRDGIITNLDIAPTILDFYRVPKPYTMLGHPVSSFPTFSRLEELVFLNEQIRQINVQRPYLLKSYVFCQIVILALSTLLLSFKHRWIFYMKPILLGLMVLPLSFLLLPLFHPLNMIGAFAVSICLTVLLTFVFMNCFRDLKSCIAAMCLSISLLLVFDVLRGSPWIKESPLGYDVMGGARYYGIGNEYMGILISCSILGITVILDSTRKRFLFYIIIGIWGGVLAVIGLPNLGANLGGLIAACVAFGLASLCLLNRRISLKALLSLGAFVPVLVILLFIHDGQRSVASQSHLGQTYQLFAQEGVDGFLQVLQRKWSMNVKLIRYTIWSRVFLVCLGAISILFYRPIGILKRIMDANPIFRWGMTSATAGCVVALLVNDSGIVAAALGMIYVAIPVLLAVMDKMKENPNTNEE
ncbi:MAG: hypothetical protein ACOX6S_03185 [Clostridia bacterium]|jgi:hypothetical protein